VNCEFINELSPGASVGLSFEKKVGGTLGGSIVTTRDECELVLGLTDFHVVAKDSVPQGTCSTFTSERRQNFNL
jgi:hypothetical protein